jgi:hypothetical protein
MAGPYRYRKVAVRTWDDEWFTALSPIPPCGQGLWLYLMTGRETCSIPGLLRVGEAGLAEVLGWPLEAFREAFREVSQDGHVVADWKRRIVWVPSALRSNPPESPNVVLGWRIPWSELPNCALKSVIFSDLKRLVEGIGKDTSRGFVEAFQKALAEPSAIQEQEQEQEQDGGCGGQPSGVRALAVSQQPLALSGIDPSEPPSSAVGSVGASSRQREALTALREISFHVVGCKGEPVAADLLGADRTRALAMDLGGDAYPSVPVRQTLAQAAAWCRSNPTKSKTARGLPRFLTRWFEKEQNRGGSRGPTAPPVNTRAGVDLLAAAERAAGEE